MSTLLQVGISSLSVPDRFRPESADTMFPSMDAQDLSYIQAAGWDRVGIVAAVVDERQRLLVLQHAPSRKIPDGAWGPPAETAQFTRHGDRITVESTAHTLSRVANEELGVEDPSSLALTARRTGAWILHSWPVGIHNPGQNAFAICPVVHMDHDAAAALQDTFQETEEITAARFMDRDEIAGLEPLRPGTLAWLSDITAGRLVTVTDECVSVALPSPAPLPGGADITFAKMGYI